MSHLTEEQRSELGRELRRQLARLERSMEVTEQAARPVELDQTAVGRLSRMDSLQRQGLTKNLQEREQVKLARIVEALKRMDEGVYGTCVECRAAIPFGRLSVFPESPYCPSCGAA